MLYERYRGEFASRTGVLWTVKIMQEADKAFTSIGEIKFPAEEPLVIEWGETGKEEPVASSTATLTVISPGDRTYEDLYAIAVGQIRMDVYREGRLYWSGTLDPEFYEEPYATGADYEVSLTFSDFGILDRLRYDLAGIRTGQEILEYVLERSCLQYGEVRNLSGTDISWMEEGTTVLRYLYGLEAVKLRSDNFYDEDGEACTLREVLEGMLQPLALRIQQKNGRIWVYDLDTAYRSFPVTAVKWMADDQMLGVDRVLNNVKVTLSTYSDSELMGDGLTYPGEYSEDQIETDHEYSYNNGYYYYSFQDLAKDEVTDYHDVDFTIFTAPNGGMCNELAEIGYEGTPWLFHIQPLLGSVTEADGVLSFLQLGVSSAAVMESYPQPTIGERPGHPNGELLMRTQRVYVPGLPEGDATGYYLRLGLEIMVDARIHPFSQADDRNEKGNYEKQEKELNYVMVPVAVTLYDEEGNAVLHYDNTKVAKKSDNYPQLHMLRKYLTGEWKEGGADWGDCWLEWYSTEDIAAQSGVAGWGKNRHNIGLTTWGLPESFKALPEGEYIPYPTRGGYLEVCVYRGFYGWDHGTTDFEKPLDGDHEVYSNVRWHLYKCPKLEVVKDDFMKNAAVTDDVEYSSRINPAAKEELEIETICGTMAKACPTARALMMNAHTDVVLTRMRRAEREAPVERLLMGTLYSQFATRKRRLSGTVELLAGDLGLYTEAMQGERRFVVVGDVQDVQADESEMSMVEVRPDEYEEENMD